MGEDLGAPAARRVVAGAFESRARRVMFARASGLARRSDDISKGAMTPIALLTPGSPRSSRPPHGPRRRAKFWRWLRYFPTAPILEERPELMLRVDVNPSGGEPRCIRDVNERPSPPRVRLPAHGAPTCAPSP